MSFHLAGIIPVVTKPMDFRMDWDDCLMPLAPNFYAIERALLECAYAGCETIWIIANDDASPIIRQRMGDYIQDPVWIGRKNRFPSETRRPIPIFYVPMPDEDRNKVNCVTWTILYGAKTAFEIGKSLSKWVAPERFWVAHPHGVYQPKELRPERLEISKDQNFCVTHKGKSFATGHLLSFTFNPAQMTAALEIFKETETTLLWGKDLENEIDFYEENFSIDTVFDRVIIEDDAKLEVPWFYQVDSWDGYCDFLGSEARKEIKHPGRLIISYREFNPVGENNE